MGIRSLEDRMNMLYLGPGEHEPLFEQQLYLETSLSLVFTSADPEVNFCSLPACPAGRPYPVLLRYMAP